MDPKQKAKLEQAVVIGGGILLAALWLHGPLTHHAAPKVSRPVQQVNMTKPLRVAMRESEEKLAEPLVVDAGSTAANAAVSVPNYTAQGLRDPLKSLLPSTSTKTDSPIVAVDKTSPHPRQVTPPPQLTVEGLVWGGARPQAIINGQLYRLGEVVSGNKILKIDRDGVTIDHEGTAVVYPAASSGPTPRGALAQQAKWSVRR